MTRKKIILILIICLAIVFGIYRGFLAKEKSPFTLAEVYRRTISQEISATGTVKKGEEINLNFKNAGRIEKIDIKVGDLVKSGEMLAKLETIQLGIQLQDTEASLGVIQAQLDKLLAGASPEEIKVAETTIKNSEISLDIARENLNQAYEDALNTLDDSYLKLYNAFTAVDSIQKKYFTGNDQEGIKVRENKEIIETAMTQAKSYLDIAKTDIKNENTDTAILKMETSLNTTSAAFAIIRAVCDEGIYYNTVSSSDKTSLDTQRTNINTALTNITNSQQNISSLQLSVDSVNGQLEAAKDNLALVMAKPRQEDINLYQAKVKQAQAQIDIIKNQIQEAALISPTDGQVTKINKKIGEIVQPTETVISLLSTNPFQIEVDIYEEDVVKMNIGNSVDVSLTAFPKETFKGKVVSIDPAEKLIEGVVYYKVTIDFQNPPENIKPGMTADLTIKTLSKENVLIIPEFAIETKGGKTIVQISEGKIIKEREIEIGLKGSDGMIEVISGLKEGEKVVIK